MNQFAIYDMISLTDKLEKQLGDVSIAEIQMFSYLSCVLSIFEGNNSNEWGYRFIKNEYGSPYSQDLENVFSHFQSNKMIDVQEDYFKLNDVSLRKYSILKKMNLFKNREKYLSVSTKSIKFLSYSQVRKSLYNEPTLYFSKQSSNKKLLLDDESASIHQLYSQFSKLRIAIDKKYDELIIPALAWMSYNTQNIIVNYD